MPVRVTAQAGEERAVGWHAPGKDLDHPCHIVQLLGLAAQLFHPLCHHLREARHEFTFVVHLGHEAYRGLHALEGKSVAVCAHHLEHGSVRAVQLREALWQHWRDRRTNLGQRVSGVVVPVARNVRHDHLEQPQLVNLEACTS